MSEYICDRCLKKFSKKFNLERHKSSCSEMKMENISIIGKVRCDVTEIRNNVYELNEEQKKNNNNQKSTNKKINEIISENNELKSSLDGHDCRIGKLENRINVSYFQYEQTADIINKLSIHIDEITKKFEDGMANSHEEIKNLKKIIDKQNKIINKFTNVKSSESKKSENTCKINCQENNPLRKLKKEYHPMLMMTTDYVKFVDNLKYSNNNIENNVNEDYCSDDDYLEFLDN